MLDDRPGSILMMAISQSSWHLLDKNKI